MHGGAWRVCGAFSSVQKKWKESLKLLGMYLATAVAKDVQEASIRDVSDRNSVVFLVEK